jgi:hypothetical protein
MGTSALCPAGNRVETADLENTINNLLAGEFSNPVRVVAFNTAERWSQDISEDIAQEVRRRCDLHINGGHRRTNGAVIQLDQREQF